MIWITNIDLKDENVLTCVHGNGEYYGDPDTVARQIREDAKRIGYGVLDLNCDSFHLPHDHALHSLELFGTEVLPQLHAA